MTCLSSHILTPALTSATTSVLVRLHKMNFSLLTHIFHLFTSLLILWCMARKWRFIHSKVFISQPRCLIFLKWPSSRFFHPALILFMFWNFFQLRQRVLLLLLVASLVKGSVSCLPGLSWLLVMMIWSLCPLVVSEENLIVWLWQIEGVKIDVFVCEHILVSFIHSGWLFIVQSL